ncbi:WD40-repeat-containing domain protein [Sporodiniella umbellata]|nr:WD40-repeat-containing domain protein [Sporodiniella umbellata]
MPNSRDQSPSSFNRASSDESIETYNPEYSDEGSKHDNIYKREEASQQNESLEKLPQEDGSFMDVDKEPLTNDKHSDYISNKAEITLGPKKAIAVKNFTLVSSTNIIKGNKAPGRRGRKMVLTRSSRVLANNTVEGDGDLNKNTTTPKKIDRKPKTKKGPLKPKTYQSKKHPNPLPVLAKGYVLSFIIEGHTNVNPPVRTTKNKESAESKDIWCCEFEPHRPGQVQTDVAAIAGSYTVLFLDIQQGRYTKKYTHSESQEIFYSMAWTTMRLDSTSTQDEENSSEELCNVLAVAGRLGSIKLLNPLQNECYRYLFGHNSPVLKMVFSKREPSWLFSASADKTVMLWDIGSPASESDNSVCLAKFSLPPDVGEPSALSVSYNLDIVIVGCCDGNLVRFHLTPEQIKGFKLISERKEKEKAKVLHPEIIYPNGSEWHAGYVDDVFVLGQDNVLKDQLANHIVSRGSEDREITVWDSETSTPQDIEIYKSLDWPDAYGSTGLRYKAIEQDGS